LRGRREREEAARCTLPHTRGVGRVASGFRSSQHVRSQGREAQPADGHRLGQESLAGRQVEPKQPGSLRKREMQTRHLSEFALHSPDEMQSRLAIPAIGHLPGPRRPKSQWGPNHAGLTCRLHQQGTHGLLSLSNNAASPKVPGPRWITERASTSLPDGEQATGPDDRGSAHSRQLTFLTTPPSSGLYGDVSVFHLPVDCNSEIP
jgi:hypothetical protein